jgi:threonine synthase
MPADNGLYMPSKIPVLPKKFIANLKQYSLQEIAFEVSKLLLEKDIPEERLMSLIDDAIDFPAPLVNLYHRVHVLELFHGPTLAFKDFGARFMARIMAYFLEQQRQEITILVATSGDTGSAVANGFLGVSGIKVVILYPKGKVSAFQERQFTTLGQNITALEVDGTFDDCQRMVKLAFLDPEINARKTLTSANSINIGRLLPQTFYYFYAAAQLTGNELPIVFSVPSGNFGNLCGGLLAKKMGLPVKRFLAATNLNDIVPSYLLTGLFEPRVSVKTIANAMDVGNPSNFTRILDLYGGKQKKIQKDILGKSYSDEVTGKAIFEVSAKYGYTLDPHSAIGYLALEDYLREEKQDFNGIFLATAHPSKFSEVVEEIIGSKVIIPERLKHIINLKKKSIEIANDFDNLKEFLLFT